MRGFRRRARIVYRDRPIATPDWRSERYEQMHDALQAEADEHAPYMDQRSKQLGNTSFGEQWWCSVCRSPWPCRFIRWAYRISGGTHDLQPLTVLNKPPADTTTKAPR